MHAAPNTKRTPNDSSNGNSNLQYIQEASPTVDDSFIQDDFERDKDDVFPTNTAKTTTTPSTLAASTLSVQQTAFPMSHIVDHQPIKQALILAATNPRLGLAGVLIGGGHGTCKSVLARSTVHLFPPTIERIAGNPFNIEPILSQPIGCRAVDSFLKEQLLQDESFVETLETEIIPTPFVTVPLNVMEESLLGSVDIEQSMTTGRTVYSPGLLARSHRGILYVDDLHLLEDESANLLLNALSEGHVTVEREGLSVQYPCRPQLVIATYNPEEGDLRDCIVDRFAMTLSSDGIPLTVQERIQVVQNVEHFHPGHTSITAKSDSEDDLHAGSSKDTATNEGMINDDDILENILQARESLLQGDNVEISRDQILYLCQEATRACCEGQRAELFATEITKTVAALHGRNYVTAEDLQFGVCMAIAPRAQVPFALNAQDAPEGQNPEEQQQQQQQQTQEQQPQSTGAELQPLEPEPELFPEMQDDDETIESEDETTKEDSDKDKGEEEEEELEIPSEFMFGVDFDVPVDPSFLYISKKLARKGKGGKRSKIFSTSRGRFVKAIFPKADGRGRLAIGATLRAAAPHQRYRREHQEQLLKRKTARKSKCKVCVTKDDFRIQRLARKAGTLVVFCVDASGSMALNRMGAAKGAAMLLLKEAYKCRDKIALIAFHGRQAQMIVPPTKSMSMTKNRLESMPCGGGSPLAHALETAIRVGLNEIKVKKDVGRVILVLLTDGRANVPLSASSSSSSTSPSRGSSDDQGGGETNSTGSSSFISSDRKLLREEVVALAKQVAILPDIDLLCIDTEDQFVGTGIAKDVCRAALGSYHHLVGARGAADVNTVAHLVQKDLQRAKS